MKKPYSEPKIAIKRFNTEKIVTESIPGSSLEAYKAMTTKVNAQNITIASLLKFN